MNLILHFLSLYLTTAVIYTRKLWSATPTQCTYEWVIEIKAVFTPLIFLFRISLPFWVIKDFLKKPQTNKQTNCKLLCRLKNFGSIFWLYSQCSLIHICFPNWLKEIVSICSDIIVNIWFIYISAWYGCPFLAYKHEYVLIYLWKIYFIYIRIYLFSKNVFFRLNKYI